MGERFPGGVISKTPPTVTGPTDGEGGSASGVWSLTEVLDYEKAGAWPKPVLARELYAWGLNGQGRLGDGTTVNRSSPVQIGALTDWSYVSAGSTFTAAVKTDGTLWTWGNGDNGRLGDGTTVAKSSPVQVGALTNWSYVSAGSTFTAAVKTDGTLWTWGYNLRGQLGDGTTVAKSSPVQVGALTNWAQVSAGGVAGLNSACFAVKTDGTLWAWGSDNSGKLGLNTNNVSRSSPVQVGALTNWRQVSAGTYSSVAIKTDGTAWAWGNGSNGRLGDGTTVTKSSPVQVGALTNWAKATDGFNAHVLVVKTDGTLWAWGYNNSGRLGDGTTVNRSSPVQIGALTDWSQTSAGGYFSSAVKTDGTVWTWGQNTNGELGDGTAVNKSSPIQVGALTTWSQASAGSRHTLAITKG